MSSVAHWQCSGFLPPEVAVRSPSETIFFICPQSPHFFAIFLHENEVYALWCQNKKWSVNVVLFDRLISKKSIFLLHWSFKEIIFWHALYLFFEIAWKIDDELPQIFLHNCLGQFILAFYHSFLKNFLSTSFFHTLAMVCPVLQSTLDFITPRKIRFSNTS